MWEILRSDAQSERRSSNDEVVAEEFINGISCHGSVAGVARVVVVVELEGKAARFMRAAPGEARRVAFRSAPPVRAVRASCLV